MTTCPWCGTTMEVDSNGELTCPYECQDDCELCGGVVGECTEEGVCQDDPDFDAKDKARRNRDLIDNLEAQLRKARRG